MARRADRLKDLAERIGPRAVPVPCDITDPAAVEALAERHGPADLLVNNAGAMLPRPLVAGRADEWRRMTDLNLTALLHVTRVFPPGLTDAAADGRPADVVNVSSTGADAHVPGFAVYGALKAAVTRLSGALRVELAATGLRVTDIKPGGVATELLEHAGLGEHPALLSPDDVAETIAYAVTRPRHVCLQQITVMPLGQAR